MKQAELAALHGRAEAALMKIPGVAGVGFGLKEVGGRTTDQASFRVYVREKKAPAELAPDEMIPGAFGGFPTDVLTVRSISPTPCADNEQHRPLIGGITITNFKSGVHESEVGTLGFFATLDGVEGPDNVVLVSNSHVLAANGAAVGDHIYQPTWSGAPSGMGTEFTMDSYSGPVAKIHDAGLEGTFGFAYPSEAELDYFVDCASAKINICISSWCNTNCGTPYKNEIRELNINGNSKIEGVARVTQADVEAPGDYEVYKVGSSTSRTTGRVVEVAATGTGGEERVIEIEVVGADCDGIAQFCAKGDSGAAVINAQNQIIGLLYGVSNNDIRKAYACHIHPVLARLGVTPISTANPPVAPGGTARADMEGMFGDGINETIPLRERFLATPKGAAFYAGALGHRLEVIELVNHCRPVTVAWHRGKGPAFLNRAINNLRHPDEPIPRRIDGVGRAALLRRMAELLRRHGSDGLVAALDRHEEEIVALADTFDDLRELAARFESEAAGTEEEAFCGAS